MVRANSDAEGDAPDFLLPALQRLAQPCTLGEFCEWFAERNVDLLPASTEAGKEDVTSEDARRFALALARLLWSKTPDPAQHWRMRVLPQPSRNDPCYCGSGRKYKQCCQALVANLPPVELDAATLAAGLVTQGPGSLREPTALRAMPALMLAATAHAWGEEHGPLALVDLLEPVFLAPRGLDARHDQAFDLLADAMLEEGLDARREQVVRVVVAEASDRHLRSTGRARLAAILSDRGAYDEAWDQLKAAQRDDAGNPELLHLELTLLLGQERLAEAHARTPLLAARARKLGYHELAEVLVEMEQVGPDVLRGGFGRDRTLDEQAWIELLRTPLPQLSSEAFEPLHSFHCEPDADGPALRIEAAKPTKRRLAEWTRRFGASLPALSSFHGNADALLEEPAEAAAWLVAHPELCAAIPVLDDLLVAARSMQDETDSPGIDRAAAELACRAAELVVQACERWPDVKMEWFDHANRPALRIVAQAIDLALALDPQDRRAMRFMQWMLDRNPNDNHGWRETLRVLHMRLGDPLAALAVLDRYPDDAPPSGHDRALALFLLQRRDEAAAMLRVAHAEYPNFVSMLLPDALDRPPEADEGLYQYGDRSQSWHWRNEVRDLWVSTGALAWVRSLELGAEAHAPGPRRNRGGGRGAATTSAPPAVADPLPVLRSHYGDRLPWLLGWLAGAAWAPELVMPAAWATPLLQGEFEARSEAQANAQVQGLMDQYNRFTQQRLDAGTADPASLPDEALDPHDDAAWAAFTAGFVQLAEQHASGAWRAAGHALDPRKGTFAPLYQLAAQAPPGPDGWRAVSDAGGALLQAADNTVPARELLARAIEPLWRATLARR